MASNLVVVNQIFAKEIDQSIDDVDMFIASEILNRTPTCLAPRGKLHFRDVCGFLLTANARYTARLATRGHRSLKALRKILTPIVERGVRNLGRR